jgi:hypothetical protein
MLYIHSSMLGIVALCHRSLSGDALWQGMLYIHSSMLGFHGNLKSSNCVVTSRWVLQITDFGLHDLRHSAESDSIGEHQYYRSKLLLQALQFARL